MPQQTILIRMVGGAFLLATGNWQLASVFAFWNATDQ
jgi:hypothetical protein